MRAYICDRCTKAYVKNETHPTIGSILGGYISGIALISKGESIDTTVDLCDDCISDLINFLKPDPGKKKRETIGV